MTFENTNFEEVLRKSLYFLLEGFNIFFIGKDDLPHIVCTAPHKDIARAIHGLLEIAKKARDLQGINGYITGEATLVPPVLASGQVVLAAMMIISDNTIHKDGHVVEFDGEFIEAGTAAYDEFIERLRKV